ncbi:hypothetical protein KTH_00810 [Thermosporothrix hazakensis]|uniref:Uncharacterized protein n=1 Tax=Thermosporothrix sp. COM3 TaxID=2490863 RepID=A0A455SD45_9CHLR|nr:hypothetical protein KTC_11280 [Thermosporothrix sp. COM3]GCE45212.1 hypothetical protein KTH_00810 [Thermosporothrix hazakensis]
MLPTRATLSAIEGKYGFLPALEKIQLLRTRHKFVLLWELAERAFDRYVSLYDLCLSEAELAPGAFLVLLGSGAIQRAVSGALSF